MIKKEVLTYVFQLWFKVEQSPSPRQFIFYMLNNYFTLAVQNDEDSHLPPQNHKQLESFLALLKEHNFITQKKCKLSKTTPPMDA